MRGNEMPLGRVNLSPSVRVARGYVGFLGAGIGGKLMLDASSLVTFGIGLVLALAGTFAALTGMFGRCPIYRLAGHASPSLKDWGG